MNVRHPDEGGPKRSPLFAAFLCKRLNRRQWGNKCLDSAILFKEDVLYSFSGKDVTAYIGIIRKLT